MEDCDGLSLGVRIILFGKFLVLVERLLPLNENFVGDQRIILFVGNLEISQKFQILFGRESLIFI